MHAESPDAPATTATVAGDTTGVMMKKRLVLLALAAALVASGCFKVNLEVDVEDDGSGTIEGIFAFNFEAIESLFSELGELGEDGVPRDEVCGGAEEEFGIDASDFDEVRPYDQDGFCGVEFSSSFGPGEAAEAFNSFDDAGSSDAVLRREGDGWYFELPLDTNDLTGDTDEIPGIENILGESEYIIRVRLPGRQVDHNGELDPEGFVVWDIDIANPPERLFLRTEPGQRQTGNASAGSDGDGGSAFTVILIVILVLAALGVAAWFLMRRRGAGQDASPASGLPAPGPTDAGAPLTPPTVDPPGDFQMPVAPSAESAPPADEPTTLMGATTADAPASAEPADPGATAGPAAETATPAAETGAGAASTDPQVIASPTPEQATGAPVWDPARRKYVQWDPNRSIWLVFDDESQSWGPETP